MFCHNFNMWEIYYEFLTFNPVKNKFFLRNRKGKAIPVTVRGRPYASETSRLSHFPHNRLTNGGEAVSLMRRPPFTRRKIPGTNFC
jgi:hypothetical protein